MLHGSLGFVSLPYPAQHVPQPEPAGSISFIDATCLAKRHGGAPQVAFAP